MFSPKDIREAEFEHVARGYNPEDVDGFLAQIATQLEELNLRREELEKRLSEMTVKVASYSEDGDALRSALITAEKVKAQTIADAKTAAEKTIVEATAQAKEIVAQAQKQSDSIVGEISSKVEIEEATLRTLKKQVDDFKNTVLNIYKEHLETLAKLPEYEPETEAENVEQPAEASAQEPSVEEQPELSFETEPAEAVTETVSNEFEINKSQFEPEQTDVSSPAEEELEAKEDESVAATSEPAADDFSFAASFEDSSAETEPVKDDDFSFDNNFAARFGKLDFGDNFTFGTD